MSQIWKYELRPNSEFSIGPRDGAEAVFRIPMPEGAQILRMREQNRMPVIWALVDTSAKKEIRVIEIYYTGRDFEVRGLRYIDTCQMPGGIVLHAFER